MDFVTPTSSKKTTNVVLDDGKIFDSPNRKKNHLPSVDNSSTVKVSQRLARRRKNQNIGPVSIKSKSNKRLINENESSDQQKNMIDKNKDGVLCSSNKSTNEKLIKLVYDNKKIIASSVYQIGKAQLSSRLPYIPYFNTKGIVNWILSIRLIREYLIVHLLIIVNRLLNMKSMSHLLKNHWMTRNWYMII